jgi:hypothetical protein
MKVYIGKYKDWVGPYQIADKVFFWLEKYPIEGKETLLIYRLHDWLGDFLAGKGDRDSWLMRFCNWLHKYKKRVEYVKLDYYDHWNAGHTMALIILPLLKALKEHKQGSGSVDLADVPEELWPSQLSGASNGYTDDTVHDRWNWVLDEMIWAFERETDDDEEDQFYDHTEAKDPNDSLNTQISKIKIDREGLEAHQQRKQNGFRLFGKYYQNLWD